MVPNIANFILKNTCDTKIAEIESEYVSNTGLTQNWHKQLLLPKKKDAKIIELENNI